MLSFWLDLPWQLRLALALVLLLISTGLYFAGRLWPWGWVVGTILLMFSFPNEAQKKGYHDF